MLVEGDGEYHALPYLVSRIHTEHEILQRPLRSPIHPLSAVGSIARAAVPSARILIGRGADRVVLLLDHEDRPACPGVFAEGLATNLRRLLAPSHPRTEVAVVVKVQAFENWLIADGGAVLQLTGLFPRSRGLAGHVSANWADHLNALDLLEHCSHPNRGYDKIKGALRICQVMDPAGAARNSRSFRRFLRVLGHPLYRNQSRLPVQ